MSIQKIQFDHQSEKLALYNKAVTIPLPQTESFSFMRIACQLTGEQHALNAQVLHHFTPLNGANDPVYVEVSQ